MDQNALIEQYRTELTEQQFEQAENPNQDRQDRINWLTNQISEIEYQAGIQQERIQTAAEESAQAVDSLELVDGLTLRDLISDEQAYQLATIAFKTMLLAKDQKYIDEIADIQTAHRDQLRASEDRESQLKRQNDALQANVESLFEQNAELRRQVQTIEFERNEAYKVRDNAATEIEGLKLALTEKDEHINKLRTEIAVGAKGAIQVDHTEQLRKAKEEWLNTRIKVMNIRWADPIRQRDYMAELVETGETITFNRLEKGKYLEVSVDEAARFRAEQAQSVQTAPAVYQPLDATPPIPAIPEVTFPEVGPVETDPSADTEVAGQDAVSREEFEALKADVEVLKRRNGMVA